MSSSASLQRERVLFSENRRSPGRAGDDPAGLRAACGMQRDILAGTGAPQRGATFEEGLPTPPKNHRNREHGRWGGHTRSQGVDGRDGAGRGPADRRPPDNSSSAKVAKRARDGQREARRGVRRLPFGTSLTSARWQGGALPADLDGCRLEHSREWRHMARNGGDRSIETADAIPRVAGWLRNSRRMESCRKVRWRALGSTRWVPYPYAHGKKRAAATRRACCFRQRPRLSQGIRTLSGSGPPGAESL